MADTSELLRLCERVIKRAEVPIDLETHDQEDYESAQAVDAPHLARALKSRLQAEAQAPAPVLTEKERVSYMQVKKCPLNKVEEALIAIIDRLTQPTPAS